MLLEGHFWHLKRHSTHFRNEMGTSAIEMHHPSEQEVSMTHTPFTDLEKYLEANSLKQILVVANFFTPNLGAQLMECEDSDCDDDDDDDSDRDEVDDNSDKGISQ